ncbi:MAG: hypothetical protein Ct9H90mP20_0540 [Candidatus Neomarinimicrobiota bacterium]|nr:MAG: hypothetical protein Ct9H90mP20_0540 [Candidatus Neomarinimicrobiota bacterium]
MPASARSPAMAFLWRRPQVCTLFQLLQVVSAQKAIKVTQRDVSKKIKLVGHGLITDVLTSALWVWPVWKHKGKDFAVTGLGSNGKPIFGM